MLQECLDRITTIAQQPDDIVGRAIAEPYPDHLRRRPKKDTQLLKILVFSDENESVFSRIFPNCKIGSGKQVCIADMDRTWIDVGERSDKTSRQIFIEKEPGQLLSQRGGSQHGALA